MGSATAFNAWCRAKVRLDGAGDHPKEQERRRASDFLADRNHDGELLDFHSLRHSCGAWLALSGLHPKSVQAVMRHSSITLTMDTYGHLFPGQEADTVARFPDMIDGEKAALKATGTEGPAGEGAQKYPGSWVAFWCGMVRTRAMKPGPQRVRVLIRTYCRLRS
jgi:hypothetical protein